MLNVRLSLHKTNYMLISSNRNFYQFLKLTFSEAGINSCISGVHKKTTMPKYKCKGRFKLCTKIFRILVHLYCFSHHYEQESSCVRRSTEFLSSELKFGLCQHSLVSLKDVRPQYIQARYLHLKFMR